MDNQQLSRYEKGQIAGMIDGDGYLKVVKKGKSAVTRICFTNSSKSMVDFFTGKALLFGCNVHLRAVNRKDGAVYYRVECTGRDAIRGMLSVVGPCMAKNNKLAKLMCQFIGGNLSVDSVLDERARLSSSRAVFVDYIDCDVDFGWMSGIFDCDGNILLKRNGSRVDRHIVFTNTNKSNLDRFFSMCKKSGINLHVSSRKRSGHAFDMKISKISVIERFLSLPLVLFYNKDKREIMLEFCRHRMNACKAKYNETDFRIIDLFNYIGEFNDYRKAPVEGEPSRVGHKRARKAGHAIAA